ncbi:unnamed protein product [Rotaria sp. Silwood2]|nr:unnamed protein product [Rotaria sp. Silwood2]
MGSCASVKKVDKKIQASPEDDYSVVPITPPPPPPKRNATKSINGETIDITSLDRIVQAADFSVIVNENIQFKSSTKPPPKEKESIKTKLEQKQPQDSNWQEKYFIHGDSSDLVVDVKNQVHGCIASSVSENIDIYLSSLHDIALTTDNILHQRLLAISSLEEKVIQQIIQERQNLIDKILVKGRSQMDQSEEYYRKLIEDFIAKLQIEMSKHLDLLQKQIEAEKQRVFSHTNSNIQDLTVRSENAKRQFLQILQVFAESKRQEVLDEISSISKDKTLQPLGYEQLRRLNVEMYSTVGMKKEVQGCDNVPDRNKHIKDINDAKPNQPIKRTVYIGTDGDSTL